MSQTDFFLKPIRDVNEEVLSKTDKIAELKKELESKQLQHSQLVEKIQEDIATKNSYVEQVHGAHAQTHTCAHLKATPLNMYLTCDKKTCVEYVPMHDLLLLHSHNKTTYRAVLPLTHYEQLTILTS